MNRYQRQKLDAAFRRAWREDARRDQKSYCFYCDELLTAKSCTADHVQARAVFGLDHRNNIVAACGPCNSLKGSMPARKFLRRLDKPIHGDSINFWLAWSRKRINRRLRLMERRLGVAA